jgi:hypothetical protein
LIYQHGAFQEQAEERKTSYSLSVSSVPVSQTFINITPPTTKPGKELFRKLQQKIVHLLIPWY